MSGFSRSPLARLCDQISLPLPLPLLIVVRCRGKGIAVSYHHTGCPNYWELWSEHGNSGRLERSAHPTLEISPPVSLPTPLNSTLLWFFFFFFFCYFLGLKIVTTIPEKTSADVVALLKSLGAEIWRTPNKAALNSPQSYIGLAKKLASELPGAFLVDEVWEELEDFHRNDELFTFFSSAMVVLESPCSPGS